MRLRWGAWLLAAVALFGGVANAQTQPSQGASSSGTPAPGSVHLPSPATNHRPFTAVISPETVREFTVEVPLVRMENARVVIANHEELGELGLVSDADGADDARFDREVLDRFAFRPATQEEIAQGRATHVGIATRYHDAGRGRSYGSVNGDGRAVLVGDVAVREAASGRVVGVYQVQVKGIGTGLRPTGTDANNWHGHGREWLAQSLHDMLAEEYLHYNGVPSNRGLAIIDSGQDFHNPSWEVPNQRAVLYVRGGNFLRLAHFNYFRSNPGAMRELFQYANTQLSAELGRTEPLSWAGLYARMVEVKAIELADTYWARALHGSLTYDNVGVFESIDHATMTTVDRTHQTFSYSPRTTPGFAGEPDRILSRYYHDELRDLMRIAAPTDADRAAIARVNAPKLTQAMLRLRMTANMLQHVGFDHDDVRALMTQNPVEVRELFNTLTELGREVSTGRHYEMGGNGPKTTVENPARYDVFHALTNLVAVHESAGTEDERVARLVEALRPVDGDRDRHVANARRLLQRLSPVLRRAVGPLQGEARDAKVRLIADQAERINRPVNDMVLRTVYERIQPMIDQVRGGGDLTRARADLRALVRANIRRGPYSAAAVAHRIRNNDLGERDAHGRVMLSSTVENGVRISELSNGRQDTLQVALSGDPLHTNDPSRYTLHFTLGDGQWRDISPVSVENGTAVFEVPMGEGPRGFQGMFFDRVTGQAHNNGGADWGRSHELATASPLVDAELAAFAARNGEERPTTPAAYRQAVSTRLGQRMPFSARVARAVARTGGLRAAVTPAASGQGDNATNAAGAHASNSAHAGNGASAHASTAGGAAHPAPTVASADDTDRDAPHTSDATRLGRPGVRIGGAMSRRGPWSPTRSRFGLGNGLTPRYRSTTPTRSSTALRFGR